MSRSLRSRPVQHEMTFTQLLASLWYTEHRKIAAAHGEEEFLEDWDATCYSAAWSRAAIAGLDQDERAWGGHTYGDHGYHRVDHLWVNRRGRREVADARAGSGWMDRHDPAGHCWGPGRGVSGPCLGMVWARARCGLSDVAGRCADPAWAI